jgi:hypothetical protein
MNQNFSPNQLIRFCKKTEINDYGITRSDLIAALEVRLKEINDGSFEFTLKTVSDHYLTECLEEKLILRKLNDNLKRLYKDEQSNRRIIVSQMKTLLEESCPMFILKTDIETFYESVERNRLIEKLKDDGMLSYHSLKLLNKIFSNPILVEDNGLPRGLSISSTLSEIYMRKFDRWVKRFPGVYFYARYVDDIIIFANQKETAAAIKEGINSNLDKGLRKKESKTEIFNIENSFNKSIQYLGYKFTIKKNKRNVEVVISIADKKVQKIKTRLVNSFLEFSKTKNFNLLENRIKFLTGNFSIRTNNDGNELKAGIYYNYQYLNDFNVLGDLNIFYHKLIHSRTNSFGARISAALSRNNKQVLSKYSFIHGYKNKVYYNFKPEVINQIKRCWI